jgi:sugar/nucleoside kinase (ribokinase family)
VVVPGRPTLDLIFSRLRAWPQPGREVYADDLFISAGAHFNTAAALARLGLDVAFVAVVGDDQLGELVLRDLRAEGVSDEGVRVVPGVPTPLSAALNLAGDRGFITYAPLHEQAEAVYVEAARDLLRSRPVRHVHADLSSAPYLVDAARRAGATISVDAHDAGPWLASREVDELAAELDVLFVNEAEAGGMTGFPDGEEAAAGLATRTRHVVLKQGARGSTAFVDGEAYNVPATPVEVVDATGAGDCFAAGYLWGFLAGRLPEVCLALGNACGARAVAMGGGYRGAPTLEELLADGSCGVSLA